MARVNRTTGFFLILGIVLLLGTVAGTAYMQNGSESQSAAPKSTENAVFASGNVDVESGLSPLVPRVIGGRVKEILVKEGDVVKAGQRLVQLDDADVREKLKIAEQELEVSRARLKDAKDEVDRKVREYEVKMAEAEGALNTSQAQYEIAYGDWTKAKDYRDSHATADGKILAEVKEQAAKLAFAHREAARNVLEKLKTVNPRPSLTEPEQALKKAELEVNAAKDLLEAYVIKAPSDGEIFEINYQVGGPAPLPPGDPNASRALVFCPAEKLIVRAEIDQEWALKVKAGMKVTLTYQAAGQDYTWKGDVERVSRYIQRRRSRTMDPDTFNDSRTRECIIRIDPDPNNPILHGMRLRVQIHTQAD
jgi:multidrug resistance efflux pump